MIVALASPVNDEPINVETIGFATAVVATVLIGQQMRVTRRSAASCQNRLHQLLLKYAEYCSS